MRTEAKRVAVVGAGPIGLVAAAHLVERGATPIVLEAGGEVGANIRGWGHVRLFSPWKYLVDPLTRSMLEASGWEMPDPEGIPTGAELVERFVAPLAALPRLAPHVRTGARVVAITRRGYDKVKSAGREDVPFELLVRGPDGEETRVLADAVIDASGTYATPNPLGAGGVPLEGERELAASIRYGIPDVLGGERSRYAGRRTLVVGSGHSAFNALLELAKLAGEEEGSAVVWAVRRESAGQMFGGGSRDALPARGGLGERMKALVESGAVKMVTGFRASRLVRAEAGIIVEGEGDRVIGPVDEVVVTTGFRPDLELARELRLGLDSWLEAPVALAPLIDPNVHSCGTVYPHGAIELAHPEKDFYTVGMKSYGRAPTFLLLTGYEQVRSVACMLTGDEAGAREVRLELPETGVCSTDLGGAACCGATDGEAAPIAGSCGIAAGCGSPEPVAAPGGLPVVRDGCC
jgi:thioredoxin reductase